MPERLPVAPELLRYVDDYVEESDVNEAVDGADLDSESNLVVFYRELFSQLFANVLGEPITSIGPSGARHARRLYRKQRHGWSSSLRALVRSYQHFCKIYPDLLGEGYAEGSDAASDLHFNLLPALLRHLGGWAKESGYVDLEAVVAASSQRYERFIEEFDPALA